MSENASSVSSLSLKLAMKTANQQGSRSKIFKSAPSETTRRTPLVAKTIQAYLQGAIHDGTYSSNHRFRIAQKGTGWLKVLRNLFKSLGYNSWIYREGKTRKVFVLETLAEFLDFHFDPLRLKTKKEQKSYIKGFFDAEGGIPHRKSYRFYIQLVQKDRIKMKSIKNMLESLGITCGALHNPSKRIDPNYWRIFILTKSHNDFVKQIGSWHPAKQKILAQREMI